MLVKDRKTKEWGFISGGVKNNETYFQAAQRELKEETSGLMSYIPEDHGRTSFKTMYRPEELKRVNDRKGEQVSSSYCVFWIPIHQRFADTLETEFVPNEEVTQIKVNEYYSFKNRWKVCDMFMDTIV
jgi:8-oxo-dGTP pyrophosphatase MutT (NUDIX family)